MPKTLFVMTGVHVNRTEQETFLKAGDQIEAVLEKGKVRFFFYRPYGGRSYDPIIIQLGKKKRRVDFLEFLAQTWGDASQLLSAMDLASTASISLSPRVRPKSLSTGGPARLYVLQ